MRAIGQMYLNTFFRSKFKVAALMAFLLLLNFLLWFQPQSSILDFGFADLSVLFYYLPYIFMIFIPSLMMAFGVDDFNQGTSDYIFSKPISTLDYWGGHFGGAFIVIVTFITLTGFSLFSIAHLSLENSNLDYLQFSASYIGMILLAIVFLALSSFASSISNNQATAYLLGVIFCFLFFTLPSLLSELSIFSNGLDYTLRYFSLKYHLDILSRGILEVNTIFYFVSLAVFFSFHSIRNLKQKFL